MKKCAIENESLHGCITGNVSSAPNMVALDDQIESNKPLDDDEYEDGTIYDPKNGKTYSCIITRNGKKLDVRGYVGFSWIGRTTTWTLDE